MSAPPATAPAHPAWVEDLFRQADTARRAGKLALSLAIYRRVVAAAPAHRAATQHLGALLTMLGRREEAEPVLRQAVANAPDDASARHALAMTLLAQGRYPEAGPFYRARFELPQLGLQRPTQLDFPEWAGEDLAGKRLVVLPEMGFGDQIQHARFAAELRDRGARVFLFCRPALSRLFAVSLPGVAVAAAEGRISLPEADYWAMSGDLMFLTGARLDALPARPYLRAPAAPPELPAGFKVGLMTAGDPAHRNDANRSLPPALAEQLRTRLPGRVVDLAPAATGARDFADTATLIDGLDLVVSVDTAVAHLAGAMGKRALVLIPAVNTDWRWMHDREDSPWYPSLRLYRADPKTGWADAVDRLTRDVQAAAGAG